MRISFGAIPLLCPSVPRRWTLQYPAIVQHSLSSPWSRLTQEISSWPSHLGPPSRVPYLAHQLSAYIAYGLIQTSSVPHPS